MNTVYTDPKRRHDFTMLFDVTDGNPNGDPDAGNLPRVDPETMQGLVTDVCLKRKIRNYVDFAQGDEAHFKIYIQSEEALNDVHQRAYDNTGLISTGTKQKPEDVTIVRKWMCENFYDVRMFGAVMTTDPNCGQVRGPMQMTFGRSVDPIVPLNLSITRIAITRPKDMAVTIGKDGIGKGGKVTEMGRKAMVPYGLYVAHGFFSVPFAEQTGVDEKDLALFWNALQNMWEVDRSASRGMMACRGLYVFSHDSKLGNAPAHKLFEQIHVSRRENVDAPRSFADYQVTVCGELPEGVALNVLLD